MSLQVNKLEDHIIELRIDRPQARGALSRELVAKLEKTLDQLLDAIPPRCVILSSEGSVFCAGADLKERRGMSEDEIHQWLKDLHRLMDKIENFDVPILASLQGPALGGGFELTMACDFRIATKNTFFQLPEVSLGIIPAGGGTMRLPQYVSKSHALEMIIFNKPWEASKAHEANYLLDVAENESELREKTLHFARRIIALPPLAVRAAKRAVYGGLFQDLHSRSEFEIKQYEPCLRSKDRVEALKAFVEKRPPKFEGY